jgi:hypothetical protein
MDLPKTGVSQKKIKDTSYKLNLLLKAERFVDKLVESPHRR